MSTLARILGAMCLTLAGACGTHAAFGAPAPGAEASQKHAPFIVFDALLYQHKPESEQLGLVAMHGAEPVWRRGASEDIVDVPGVEESVQRVRQFGTPYYFDIENWPVLYAPDDVVDASIAKLLQVADIARRTSPDGRFGFYGLLPQSIYWPFQLKKEDEIAAWRRSNERTAVLAAHVDYVLPSLYTAYDDPENWKVSAREVLLAARRYGKPVYPFLWPEFHDTNVKLRGKPVPVEFWRMQLEFCRQYADGVVLWGGYQRRWDDTAPWWLETQRFLATLQ
jgi:hypothetical protein